VKLSSKLQVWVPIELMSVVQSLWARAQPDDVEREGETFHAHEIRIWSLFLLAIHQTKPKYASAPKSMQRPAWRHTRAPPQHAHDTTHSTAGAQDSQSLSPASRAYLLRIAFAEFVSAFNGNNIHAVLAELHKYAITTTSTLMHS
jgi:hypothetical protein